MSGGDGDKNFFNFVVFDDPRDITSPSQDFSPVDVDALLAFI